MTNELTGQEQTSLVAYEVAIEQGAHAMVKNLIKIRDGRLYRAAYRSFEEYCLKRWNITRQHVNNLIRADKTRKNLETLVSKDEMPTKEKHFREVARAPVEKQAEVVRAAKKAAESENRKPVARDYAAARDKVAPTPKPARGREMPSAAKLVASMEATHFSGRLGLPQMLQAVAEANGGEGRQYKLASDGLNAFLVAIRRMGDGEK